MPDGPKAANVCCFKIRRSLWSTLQTLKQQSSG